MPLTRLHTRLWLKTSTVFFGFAMSSATLPTPPSTDSTSARDNLPPRDPSAPSSQTLSLCIWGASVILTSFLVGSAITQYRVFPYPQFLAPAYTAAHALQQRWATTSTRTATDLWEPARFERRGVVHSNAQLSAPGYTLYTSGHASSAFLIDASGTVVHQWDAPFHTVFPRPTHVANPVPEPFIHWRRAHLYDNGDLLAMYECYGDTPWGYGLVKVDAESRVLWSFPANTHHDLCVTGDGTIYTLTHRFRRVAEEPVAASPELPPVVLDDQIVQLDAEGNLIAELSLLDALARSPYRDLLTTVPSDEWDLLHTNTVRPITEEFAQHHDFAEAGQLLISWRSRQALAIVDMESESVVWATCGPFRYQHDPLPLANGNIMLFDNRGHVGPGGASRIIEFDPAHQTIHWQYNGSADKPFFSLVRATQQQLPNGNVLITESSAGRLLEVTRNGELAWEFRNPADLSGDPSYIPIVCGAQRLDPEGSPFLRNLAPPINDSN